MVQQLYYYESHSLSPYYNLALEDILRSQLPPGGAVLYLWKNDHTVVIGKHQSAYHECDLEAIRADGVSLARRKTGGGAVFHDAGNLNFTFLNRREDYDLNRNFEILLEALKAVGVPAVLSGRNDLTAEGLKFSGNAFFKSAQVAYHHGTLMVEVSMEKLARYLRVSPLKLRSKAVASVRSRVVNLCQICPALTLEALTQSLQKTFAASYGLPLLPGPAWDENLRAEAEKSFASSAWILGEKPNAASSSVNIEERFDWGCVLISGVGSEMSLYSDALDTEVVEYLRSTLLHFLHSFPGPIPVPDSFTSSQKKMVEDINELLKRFPG